uniref:GMP reductase n=1 Tax=viral metagenome TaxID=1070528 RepID=A0A6C0KLR4_9ZZZZ
MTDSKRFDFQDINLIPRKCIVESRNDCSTSFTMGNHTFHLPVVPANMECVINDEVAVKLAKAGYFYIHNRFTTNVLQFSRSMRALGLPISISIGVNEDAYEIMNSLKAATMVPDFVTIDIAHGHSVKMEKMLHWIRETFTDSKPFIIAGNVSTPEAVKDLESWGADAVKVGIGPGSACTTFNATGFGSRNIQASVIQECFKAKQKSSTMIVADGGIKDPGDIAKSLVLGADLVMIGGMFSALTDSPGATVRGVDGQLYKEFWGSASVFQSGKKNRIEGTKKLLPLKTRSILEEMEYIKECLQSAISYGGGKDLSCLKDVKYI